MKVFIYHIYFSDEDLKNFIKNNSNNENWPKQLLYQKQLKKWAVDVKKQMDIAEKYRDWSLNKKKSDDNFLIQIKNVINQKLKIIRDPKLKYLDPETEKRELTEKQREKEIKDLKTAQEIYSRPEYWEKDWANTKKIQKIDLEETWRQLNQWNNNRDYPIEEVGKLLKEWKVEIDKKDKDFPQIKELKTFEVELKERTKNTITFIWNVAEIDCPVFSRDKVDSKGNPLIEKQEKRLVLAKIDQFLFFFGGQYYEVLDWKQTNYNTVEITAEISIFYSYYWDLFLSRVNGIFHHYSGISGGEEEICSCAEYDVATNWHDFASDYRLKLTLFKTDKSNVAGGMYYCKETDTNPPSISSMGIHKVPDVKQEVDGEGENFLSSVWTNIWNATVGTVYFTLSDELGERGGLKQKIATYEWRQTATDGTIGDTNQELLTKLYDLYNPIMYHFLRNHIKGTLFWRKKLVWQGNYWLISEGFRVEEIVNPAGTTVLFWAKDLIIGQVTENIMQKVGGNALVNKFVDCIVDTALSDEKGTQNRQTERNVISESSSGGKTKQKETTTKTTTKSKDLSGQDNKPGLGSSILKPILHSVDHTKSEYTSQQFEKRYFISGRTPLTGRLEFNQNLLNQYRSRRELKGMPLYSYFNAGEFGSILNAEGFFQASIISLSGNIPSWCVDWFRSKLEEGIYLYGDDCQEFYQRKLALGKNVASTSSGGGERGHYNYIQSVTDQKEDFSYDKYVHIDNLSWIWKISTCRPASGGTDLFPELIRQIALTSKLSSHSDSSAWKFEGNGNGRGEVPLPKGVKHFWLLKAFSPDNNQKKYMTGQDDHGKLILTQAGAKWSIKWQGKFLEERVVGDPKDIPPAQAFTTIPSDPNSKTPPPFNPMTPMPTATLIEPDPLQGRLGGDPELEPPEPELEPEPEPEIEREPEQEVEPDPEQEREPEPEQEKEDEQEMS